jgi:predicted phosphatase
MVGCDGAKVKQPYCCYPSVKKGCEMANAACWTVKVLSLVAIRVMLLEQVFSEVTVEVAPYGVNVIGIVLRVIELDQE